MIQGLLSKRFGTLVAGMVSLTQFAPGMAAHAGSPGPVAQGSHKPAYQAIDLGSAYADPDFQSSKILSPSGKVALTLNLGAAGNWQFHATSYFKGKETDLGALGMASVAVAINAAGQIAGNSDTPDETTEHAVLFSKGTILDLGTLPGGTFSVATGINNQGDVIGQSTTNNDTSTHGFIYSHGKMTDLGAFDGDYTLPYDINNAGQVVGASYINVGDSGSCAHPFLYSDGKLTDLGTLGNAQGDAWATRINEAGQVIGFSQTPEGLNHGFLYSSGTLQDLGAIAGGETYPMAINNKGQIAGVAYTDVDVRVFLWENGKLTDLGIPCDDGRVSLNETGEIVGGAYEQSFLYAGGQAYDLNALIAQPGTLAYLERPVTINNSGEILVYGVTQDGEEHSYLLAPVSGDKVK